MATANWTAIANGEKLKRKAGQGVRALTWDSGARRSRPALPQASRETLGKSFSLPLPWFPSVQRENSPALPPKGDVRINTAEIVRCSDVLEILWLDRHTGPHAETKSWPYKSGCQGKGNCFKKLKGLPLADYIAVLKRALHGPPLAKERAEVGESREWEDPERSDRYM